MNKEKKEYLDNFEIKLRLFVKSYKRLFEKSQVVPHVGVDIDTTHLQNRGSHSEMVAIIAKQIATNINKEYGCEVIELEVVNLVSLLHDIGHPPFGHVVEKSLDEILSSLYKENKIDIPLRFEGNNNNITILEKEFGQEIENNKYLKEILVGTIKYPENLENGVKKGLYKEYYEKYFPILKEIKEKEIEKIQKKVDGYNPVLNTNGDYRTLASVIMEYSDDISYLSHDYLDLYYLSFNDPNNKREELRKKVKDGFRNKEKDTSFDYLFLGEEKFLKEITDLLDVNEIEYNKKELKEVVYNLFCNENNVVSKSKEEFLENMFNFLKKNKVKVKNQSVVIELKSIVENAYDKGCLNVSYGSYFNEKELSENVFVFMNSAIKNLSLTKEGKVIEEKEEFSIIFDQLRKIEKEVYYINSNVERLEKKIGFRLKEVFGYIIEEIVLKNNKAMIESYVLSGRYLDKIKNSKNKEEKLDFLIKFIAEKTDEWFFDSSKKLIETKSFQEYIKIKANEPKKINRNI
jgi:dGTP triphosphohydrolase